MFPPIFSKNKSHPLRKLQEEQEGEAAEVPVVIQEDLSKPGIIW